VTTVRAIRGMVDLLPAACSRWQWVEQQLQSLMDGYGYGEIRLPLMELTALYQRDIGEVTDIVEKEMYSFDDRSGNSMTLRPEGTAGCVRAAIQHGLLQALPQRLWYSGPMFRYERPQMGRQRQFHQWGVELLGSESPDAEAELLLLSARAWSQLGVQSQMVLELNTLGDTQDRVAYRDALTRYLEARIDLLDEDSKRRLATNPLRILDSKVESTRALLQDAPQLAHFLSDTAREHFDRLLSLLNSAGVAYRLNSRLVRGLDYYNRTVFEWVTDALGAQGTVCAGGRYDGLIPELGGPQVPACGFAIGLERLLLMLEQRDESTQATDVYAIAMGDAAADALLPLVEQVRSGLPGLSVVWHLGGGSMRSMMKKADKSGAQLALLVGDDELQDGTVVIKSLRDDSPQQKVPHTAVVETIARRLQHRGESNAQGDN
jgi:histidyl-tRNA synthetase